MCRMYFTVIDDGIFVNRNKVSEHCLCVLQGSKGEPGEEGPVGPSVRIPKKQFHVPYLHYEYTACTVCIFLF